jgi:putative membrane protein
LHPWWPGWLPGWTLLVLWLASVPVPAQAHGALFSGPTSEAPIWLSPALYTLAWFGYAFGAGVRRPQPRRRLIFHATMLLTGLALFGPFDDMAAHSSAWHMVQHMLLIVVVAPLLVLARPLPQWRAAFGPLADALWRASARLTRRPMACALLHAAAIWFWHAPVPYMAAVMHTGLHVLEHACFLGTGWLFWWSVLRPGRAGVLPASMALLFTVMHTGLLGALLTFADTPLYWRESRELWDQQLAGLVMWIPGGLVYLLAAVWAAYRWLAQQERGSLPVGRSAY